MPRIGGLIGGNMVKVRFLAVLIASLSLLATPAVAVDYYEPATPTDKNTATSSEDSLIRSARAAISKKQWSKARQDLIKADKLNSRNADTKNLLGYVNRQMGQTKPAMRYYRAALRIDPNHRGANEYLGELFLTRKQPAKAQAQLKKLEQICGTNCAEYKTLQKSIAKYKK
jgi:Flp pilus assembly protein TadD